MAIKKLIKIVCKHLGFEKALQEANYKLSYLNRRSKHHRKRLNVFYRQFISKGDLVFDVGANAGERVFIFHELGAKIVAIEPQKKLIEEMKEKFFKYKNLQFEQVGLGEEPGELELFICEEDDRLSTFSSDQINKSFFSENTQWRKKEIITITTLDFLIKKYGIPKFCKIDVEGFEFQVLKGLSQTVPALSFEFSSKQIDKIHQCLDRIQEINNKYEFNIAFGEPYFLKFENWVNKANIIKAIHDEDVRMPTHAWGDIYAKIVS